MDLKIIFIDFKYIFNLKYRPYGIFNFLILLRDPLKGPLIIKGLIVYV